MIIDLGGGNPQGLFLPVKIAYKEAKDSLHL